MVYQIAYVSLSKTPLDTVLLSDILTASKNNNTLNGISGVLMYHDQLFFQVLEGERTLVKNCYRRILRDPRHSSISLMWEGEAETRAFASWAMGYAGPDEIGQGTNDQLALLANLTSGKDVSTNKCDLALQLAIVIFRSFSGVGRFGQAVPIMKPESERRTSCRAVSSTSALRLSSP